MPVPHIYLRHARNCSTQQRLIDTRVRESFTYTGAFERWLGFNAPANREENCMRVDFEFRSGGELLHGNLFLPEGEPQAALVLTGPLDERQGTGERRACACAV